MQDPDVFVAGVGVISALGKDRDENVFALQSGRSGIGPISLLKTVHRNTYPVAEVRYANEELEKLTGFTSGISRTALLSCMAATEAMHHAGIPSQHSFRIGFVSANSVGGMDKSEDFYEAFHDDSTKGNLEQVIHHECGSVTELVANKLGIRHFVSTISTACSSSANAIFHAARLIKNNMLDIVIAGGTDSLTRFTLNGFSTLMILDTAPCKPLDENRKGLNLGEGAGYLVLVSENALKQLNATPLCKLSGYHNANDAHHQTASSPEGIGSFLAMQGALNKSGIRPRDIGYINLHGTGTQNNDQSEGTAIRRVFGDSLPKLSSTKTFTGHTLGASGGIEAVYSVLSLKHGYIYPNLRFETPMKEIALLPETEFSIDPSIKHVLSNSFGFGGNCTSLIFSAC